MVIQFSISNYRSIHHTQKLNFRATTLKSEKEEVDVRNVSTVDNQRILKTIGIYGPNGSGKSNIIRALVFFKNMVTLSLNFDDLARFESNPFKQAAKPMDNGGFFEMVLLLNNSKYRYGFSLDPSGIIQSEWLSGPAEKNETYYFTRKFNEITANEIWFQESDDLPKEKLRSNALFLSFCASYDGTISSAIRNFITQKISVDSISEAYYRTSVFGNHMPNSITDNLISAGKKKIILQWMGELGMNYSDVAVRKVELGKDSWNNVIFSKNVYDDVGNVTEEVEMNLNLDESEGTRKYYSYIGRLYEKFEHGGLFISDEIDSNFHPSLLRKLICFFNNPDINKANAQLLFTSHDTNLMDPDIMRRDQFYFTEKSNMDETILYSLSDLKGIRNNADFAKQYLAGLYGALPILGTFLTDNNTK